MQQTTTNLMMQNNMNATAPPQYATPERGQYKNHAQAIPNTVIVQQPQRFYLDRHPQNYLCSFCNQNVVTEVNYDLGLGSWIVIGALCIFTVGVFGLIPCCVSSCQDAVHRCPNCRRVVGKKKFLVK